MQENVDYRYITEESDLDSVHIELLTGDYKDTIFKYGKVKFEEKNDEGYLHFDFDVLKCTSTKPRKLEKSQEFRDFIGNLLVEIISNRLMGTIDESGTTNIEESDL